MTCREEMHLLWATEPWLVGAAACISPSLRALRDTTLHIYTCIYMYDVSRAGLADFARATPFSVIFAYSALLVARCVAPISLYALPWLTGVLAVRISSSFARNRPPAPNVAAASAPCAFLLRPSTRSRGRATRYRLPPIETRASTARAGSKTQ